MPLNASGKVDRSALPKPGKERPDLESAYQPPGSPEEIKLAQIWQEVLKVERVGMYDNFFALGGHSLLATLLISRVREAMQVEMPLRSVFENPTIAGMVGSIEIARSGAQPEQRPATAHLPL